VQVDAFGRPVPNDRLRDIQPVGGRRLRLSLDLALEKTGQSALSSIGGGRPGAFVALDPRDGQVLAMGSHPSYDPAHLTKPITQKRYDALFGDDAGAPRFNRAIQGQYPTGSTFKPITALAALDRGLIDPGTQINDTGCIQIGEQERCNAKKEEYGAVDLSRALTVSSDIYFYRLGRSAFYSDGDPIQDWARKLGFDRPTGIDLPGEFGGVIPDTRWREEINRTELRCRKKKGISARDAGSPTCATTTSVTRSTSRSGRATSRRRRCSSPSYTPRSPTAARSSSRISGWRSRPTAAS